MKRTLTTHFIGAGALIVLSILLATIVSFIRFKDLITGNTYDIVIISTSSIIFFLVGLFIGLRVNKRGFLHALLFGTIYLVFAFLFNFLGLENSLDLKNITIYLSRVIVLAIAAIIGRNLKV